LTDVKDRRGLPVCWPGGLLAEMLGVAAMERKTIMETLLQLQKGVRVYGRWYRLGTQEAIVIWLAKAVVR